MTPKQYIDALPEPTRTDVAKLHDAIKRAAPDFKPAFANGMIGYGKFHYRYETGREGDAFRIALASRKTGISVYVLAMDEGGYLAEQAKPRLGKAIVGKSCIRFKRLADIDLAVLTALVKRAAKLTGPGEV